MCKRLQGTVTADDNAEQEYCYVYTNSISALFSPIHRIRHLNWVHVDAIEVLCRMQRQHFLTIRHPMAVSIRSVLLLRFPASSSCCLVLLLYHLFASSVSSYCLPRPIVFYFLLSSTSCPFLLCAFLEWNVGFICWLCLYFSESVSRWNPSGLFRTQRRKDSLLSRQI